MPVTIENGQFYVVRLGERFEIHQHQQGAIDALKSAVEGSDEMEEEDLEITEVEVGSSGGEEWTLRQMPWRDIAVTLLRSE